MVLAVGLSLQMGVPVTAWLLSRKPPKRGGETQPVRGRIYPLPPAGVSGGGDDTRRGEAGSRRAGTRHLGAMLMPWLDQSVWHGRGGGAGTAPASGAASARVWPHSAAAPGAQPAALCPAPARCRRCAGASRCKDPPQGDSNTPDRRSRTKGLKVWNPLSQEGVK